MSFDLNIPSVVMLISGTILFLIVFFTIREKIDASAVHFKRLMMAASFWSFANGIELASNDVALKIILSKLSYIGICGVMPLWLLFVLSYIKREKIITGATRAVLYGIPAVMLILVFTNELHHLVWPTLTPYKVDGGIRIIYGHGAAVFAYTAYCALIMIFGTVLLLHFLINVSSPVRRQVWLVLIASIAPWISNMIYILGYSPIPAVDLTPIGFIITGIVFQFAITRLHMLDLMPVARYALFDELIDGVLVLDSKIRVADVNSTAAELLNISVEKIIGCPLQEVLPELSKILLKTTEDSKIRNEHFELDTRIINARISSLADKDVLQGHLVVFRDVTDFRQAQIELLKAKDEAEAANIAKSQFLANVSHDIRTPMNGIMGFLELLGDTGLNREQSEYLNDIKSAAGSLLYLLNEILDYSRAEAGRLQFERIPFDLHQLIKESVSLFVPAARKKGTNLEYGITEEVPEKINSDPFKFRQILNNIIGNAVKFTENGQIRITANATEKDGLVLLEFEIRDTGIGMSQETIKKLFQAFTQADASTTRKYGGSGLGLAISKKIIDLLGGNVVVESEPGVGSCFKITLPVEKAESEESAVKSSSTDPSGKDPVSPSNTSILLVEDIAANRKLATLLLQKMGYTVECAENGKQAVEMCNDKAYALVLMDCQMPVMDGYEASKEIRSGGGCNCNSPIVAMTADVYESDREKCLQAGMDDHISKPVSRSKLEECINRYLRAAG